MPSRSGNAEAGEHNNKISDIQRPCEDAHPALEPAAGQRRDHHGCADDEAGRDIEQHTLPLNGLRAALQQGAQRHDERQIEDVRADDIADRERGLLFADGNDGRDELRQRGADGDHRGGDNGIRHADAASQLRAVVDEQLRAKHDGGRAEHELADVPRDGPSVLLRLFRGLLSPLLAPPGQQTLGHVEDEYGQNGRALPQGETAVAREDEQQADGGQQQAGLPGILPARHGALHTHEGDAQDEAGVGRDGADGVAHGDVRVSLEGGEQ